ncbi:Type I restriction enzyme EcoEI M protein [Planktothrix agardhii]|uniref:site-specific DNA-methyltransferase (adenine-specific) n=1 Tax=Planktothrix agardhii TaxID=1160 RepID=A0A1J1JFH8_PLAAG|nr:N-6 DNA methylase [Planktothrix agardhii]CAD5942874.1 Type I restriction enzyme EcoEI M protein [Planktothrix agardhii]CUM60264.1 N-6 DNA methylase [Planktothrix agardhii]
MLDTDTKRRIDTARDILVGKVPDPKSQVEQITIALIYKFMDDMDAESEELGGDRQFFTGKFAAYGWSRLMSPSVGGHELIRLYEKGISTMPENQGIPALFRDIFKNAYLPYRDPETLKSFLKIINEFSYDHSEKLGDAFEYLLSVLGSQGDAGQFRTPRHIIDFIVEIIQPKKGEVILDPACGTAGFLISAYKHILRNNRDVNNISTLTPDEKGGLAKNFRGYDISPDMVRLSLVNLYLHGFNDPHILEYDTLTSEDRWNEFADVILANPPFMSPKGGIKPHKRFSIKAKRSEVLFVDYIAEHLTPKGRAGIIVPEGIIFQSQTAYKDLRRMLLNNALVAVISLPAGVFNPYSGVKTSILILDKSLAKLSNTVAFFKVENDGFGLGAQRREVTGEQLTQVKIELELYLQAVRNQELTDNLELTLGLVVPKVKIAANGDYNFSGERYRENNQKLSHYPIVQLGDICDIKTGKLNSNASVDGGAYPFFTCSKEVFKIDQYAFDCEAILLSGNNASGDFDVKYYHGKFNAYQRTYIITIKPEFLDKITYQILRYILNANLLDLKNKSIGGLTKYLTLGMITSIEIPILPIAIQQNTETGDRLYITSKNVRENYLDLSNVSYISEEAHRTIFSRCPVRKGDVLYIKDGANTGLAAINTLREEFSLLSSVAVMRGKCEILDNRYLVFYLNSAHGRKNMLSMISGVAITRLTLTKLNSALIPLPPLEIQKAIVAEIEAEQILVNANRELITRFEKKIQTTLNRIWGEE